MPIDAEVTTASSMKRKTDVHNKMNGNKTKKTAGKKRGHPVRSVCRALIPPDTAKIRKEYLKEYKRRKKVLEKLEAQLQQYEESDEPEFQKFLASTVKVRRIHIMSAKTSEN